MLQLLQGHKKEEVYVFLSFQIVCQKVSVVLSVRLLDSSFPSASTWAAYGGTKIAQCGSSLGAGWEQASRSIAASSGRASPGAGCLRRGTAEKHLPITAGHWPWARRWILGWDYKQKRAGEGEGSIHCGEHKNGEQRGLGPPAAGLC